jgi:hypothetical protein
VPLACEVEMELSPEAEARIDELSSGLYNNGTPTDRNAVLAHAAWMFGVERFTPSRMDGWADLADDTVVVRLVSDGEVNFADDIEVLA